MKSPVRMICALLLLAGCSGQPRTAANDYQVERIVMVMRHGIRPPTKAQPIPAQYSPETWPSWTVEPGLLTERGAQGIALLAAADRSKLIAAGLLPRSGCPEPGTVSVHASNKARAIETAEVWVKAALPNCAGTVDHPAEGATDALCHALDEEPSWFDGHRAYEEAMAQAPAGGLEAEARSAGPEIKLLEKILGCAPPACDLESEPTVLEQKAHDRPDLAGPLDVASTASQSLLLEYLEGMPMSEVGWGRATRADIERLLVFHPIKFKYANRPQLTAKASAGPLAQAIVQSLTSPKGPRIALFAGHDTNLADLGGLLAMHWHAASYPADDIPPGGALGFELLRDKNGSQFVRAFFRSQTMDQLRNLQALGDNNPPFRDYLDIPGCGSAADPSSCSLAEFVSLVGAKTQ